MPRRLRYCRLITGFALIAGSAAQILSASEFTQPTVNLAQAC
jgi:hypothetical protein